MKEESEKSFLKFIQKIKFVVASGPITSWQTKGEKVGAVTDFVFLGAKITAVSSATKLKNICSLKEKL